MEKKRYRTISAAGHTNNTSFVSVLFFQWMNIVFKRGSEGTVQQNDFLPLSAENTSRVLSRQLQIKWEKETTNCRENGKKPRLWKSVGEMLSAKDIVFLFSTGAVFTLSRILQPLFVWYLIVNLMSAEPQRNYILYGCALGMFINEMIGVVILHHFSYRAEVLGIRISAALKCLVYQKVSTKGHTCCRTAAV